MTAEEKILLSNLEEKAAKCDNLNMITCSAFLDMHEKSLATAVKAPLGVTRVFYGGFDGAERNMAVFMPEYTYVKTEQDAVNYFAENPEDCPLRILKISKDKFSKPLGHRDYLGAVMGLGINRNVTGDILVNDGGCLMAVTEGMAEYIADNLDKAGRGTLKIEIMLPSQVEKSTKAQGTPVSFTVSSPRLDSIIKNCFGVSRTGASEAIEHGLVFVNDVECLKPDRRINEGDKIVMRHKGRLIINDLGSISKKGRVIVKATQF